MPDTPPTPYTLSLDGRSITALPGQTVLDAARAAGCDIPTLCYQPGIAHRTSCFLCAVRVQGHESLQPACSMPVRDGMVVTTDSSEIDAARKTALELLFSDHAGRCEAPCSIGCPAHLAIPEMMEALARGDAEAAARVARRDLVFPETLAALCPAFCEGPCVRKQFDRSIEIRRLHGLAAQASDVLPACASGASDAMPACASGASDAMPACASEASDVLPACGAATGKRVAIVGADPVGLATAWFLQLAGHACTVHGSVSLVPTFVVPALAGNRHTFPAEAGTTNVNAVAGAASDLAVFAREIESIRRLGVGFVPDLPTADSADAFVLTHDADVPGLPASSPQVFRAKFRLTDPAALVRAVAAGRALASEVEEYFAQSVFAPQPVAQAFQPVTVMQPASAPQPVAQAFQPATATPPSHSANAPQSPLSPEPRQAGKPAPRPRPLYFAARAETEDERRLILAASPVPPLAEGETILPPETCRGVTLFDPSLAGTSGRAAASRDRAPQAEIDTADGPILNPQSEIRNASSIVSREADRCLRCGCVKRDTCRLRHYGARFGARPHRFQGARRELAPDVTHAEIVYEPGKCILCGLCLKIAEAAGEAPGLAFVGRGFPTRVAVPFDDGLASALRTSARACAEACPTAALSLRQP